MKSQILAAIPILLLQWLTISTSWAVSNYCNYNTPGYKVNQYTINEDGTVYDNYSGLTWQRCIMGRTWNPDYHTCDRDDTSDLHYDWNTTLVNVKDYNAAEILEGRNGTWRVPNIKELASIISLNCVYPAIDTEIFPTYQSKLWSSTPSATDFPSLLDGSGTPYIFENAIWNMNILTGKETRDERSTLLAVLLVRDTDDSP